MIMALQVFTDLMALLWQHPLLSGLALLLFTPPFFPIVKFFSPLLISTALFMLALFTMGGPEATSTSTTEENWEFRRAADVQVWEDKSVSRRPKGDGSWMEYMQILAESSYAWIETKLQNQNSKVSALNDDNVSILQEASWPIATRDDDDEEPSPNEDINVSSAITLFKPDSKVKVPELGEDVLKHEPLSTLEVPNKTVTDRVIDNSPSTDVEDSDRLILSTVKRDSMNASLGLSDDGTPVALSKSGKLKQIEMLGELIEEKEQHRGDVPVVLMATIAEQVEAVKEKLEDFKHSPEHENKPGSPLFKQGKKEKEGINDVVFKEEKEATKDVVLKKSRSAISDDSSSGEEMLSDSDSDAEYEIFPPVDPAKMKLHPPVKLDILELEKKLGTSLSQRTRAPKGEITELH